MKTKVWYLLTNLFVVVVLVAVLAVKVNAAGAPKVKIIPFDNESAIIAIANSTRNYAELAIENEAGDMVFYSEGSINTDDYKRVFNFKNLRNGSYKVIVKSGVTESIVNFKVENGNLTVEENATAAAPYFEVKNNILKLSLLNDSKSNVILNLTSGNEVVYSKNLGSDFDISTGFNLKNLEPGNYAVSLTAGDNTFNYNFEK